MRLVRTAAGVCVFAIGASGCLDFQWASDDCDARAACGQGDMGGEAGADGAGSLQDAGWEDVGPDGTSDATGNKDASVDGEAGHSDGAPEAGGCSGLQSLACDGGCVDPTSPDNCGSCGHACSVPEGGHATCTQGVCGTSCDGTLTDCNGACVDTTVDPVHCGAACTACPGPTGGPGQATCIGGMCSLTCSAGYHVCEGECRSDSDDPSSDGCVIGERFGIFVSPQGSDNSAGTMLAPVATIGHAIDVAKAAGKAVFACGSAGSYTSENLLVGVAREGVRVYGGLDCSNPAAWRYDASKQATVAPASNGYALEVTGLTTGVVFEDFAFVARDGSASGESSVGVFVQGSSNVVLRRCTVTAGAGVAGQDAAQPPGFGNAAPSGNGGTANARGLASANPVCPGSVGGAGGAPVAPGGANGDPGTPGSPNEGVASAQDCGNGSSGKNGAAGTAGGDGEGAGAWGTVASSGWTPAAGSSGALGAVGQGGGGGASTDGSGGGGSGGAGGCGGAGGPGGGGGGSSIAILAYNASLDLESCTLKAANGAAGGKGAPGQTGQGGGTHGNGAVNACQGGKGGSGGNGGGGGGGAGGVSAGVLWSGATAPTINGVSVSAASSLAGVSTGAAGAGGQGPASNVGKTGTAAAVISSP
jgi:hypothetical protein